LLLEILTAGAGLSLQKPLAGVLDGIFMGDAISQKVFLTYHKGDILIDVHAFR